MKAQYLKPTPVLRMPEYFGPDVVSWPPYLEKKPGRPLHHLTGFVWAPRGTYTTHPECWRLAQAGVCSPADKECELAAGYSDEKIQDQSDKYDLREQSVLYIPD